MPAFRHAVFDLDSTLVDTLGAIASTREALVRRLVEVTRLPDDAVRAEVADALQADFHNPELVRRLPSVQAWLSGRGREAQAEIEQVREDYYRDVANGAALLPGVTTVLDTLRAHDVGCVIWSNKKSPFVRLHLHDLGLDDGRVRAAYCTRPTDAHDVPEVELPQLRIVEVEREERKPNPSTLQRILRENEFEPSATVFLGNNVKNDGGATLGTGVTFVLVDWGIPTRATQDAIFRLTRSERLSYDIGSRLNPEYPWYRERVPVHATLTAGIDEILRVFGLDADGPPGGADDRRPSPVAVVDDDVGG